MKNLILTIAAVLALNIPAFAATLGTTTGADFSTATWTNGASTSVGTWWHVANPGSVFGIGNSSQGGRPSIGSSAFNLIPGSYTNSNQGYARTYFVFNEGALTSGQSVKFDINFLWNNGVKGFALEGSGDTSFFTLFQDWGDPVQAKLGSFANTNVTSVNVLTNGYQKAVSLEAIQNNGSIDIRLADNGLNIYSNTIATANFISQIQFFAGNMNPTEEANAANHGIYFNNISIIPEPSTPLLMGLGLAGLLALRKTRKA